MHKFKWYGLTEKEYKCCLPQIKTYAQHMAITILNVAAIIFWLLFFVSLVVKQDIVFRNLYLTFAIIFSVFYAFHILLKKIPTLLMQYFYILLLFCFSTLLSLQYIDSPGATFHVMLVMLPQLLIDKPIRAWTMIITVALGYCILIIIFKESGVWFAELYNTISLCIVACITSWVTNRGKLQSFLLHVQNKEIIDELTIIRQALKEKADRDGMTKLYNRSKFQQEIQETQLKLKQQKQSYAALFVLDVDNFKQINDIHGHHKGDVALISVANTLLDNANENCYFARLGGDEFAGYYFNYEDSAKLYENIQQLYDKLNQIYIIPGELLHVSLGVVVLTQEKYQSFEQLYTLADQQMYLSKQNNQEISWTEI